MQENAGTETETGTRVQRHAANSTGRTRNHYLIWPLRNRSHLKKQAGRGARSSAFSLTNNVSSLLGGGTGQQGPKCLGLVTAAALT